MKIIPFLQVPFAVRSVGHSPNPNWSGIGFNGILISTTSLDSLTVSSDNSIASIEPGLGWGAVIPQVGVGGLILGGGLSHFSAQYGLAADNVKTFEFVLASGEIVNTNAETNSDPFWALKGGGPNFATAYSLTVLPSVLAAFTEWQKNGAQTDPKTSVLNNILSTGCSLGLVYSEPATYPDAFAPLAAIPNGIIRIPATNATVTLLSTILGGAFSTASARHVYRSAASLIDETLYNETSSYYFDTINSHQAKGVKVNMTFTLQTIPPSLVAASESRGGNPMGFPSLAHQWWTTITDWASEKDDETVLSAVKSIGDQFETLGAARNSYLPYLYMNDCYADQNPLTQYPPANIKTMKYIAAKYDPSRVFQLLQKDGCLLSKA
ncbi:hypothetical protein BOTCAL_1250g00010 [Botryotinia calthae]|uniref:FAD linked oxidase N-terminal domain-containing protein n=1 Tax=Botryotinia calthae TaxID=38488 RepID=A0A4Y8CCW6_9HELO|nr:hypothetical protein BOTCAL_1250g00010 [Botryotinia calthae]